MKVNDVSFAGDHGISLNRRRLLKVAAASLLVVSGCAMFRQPGELDSSISNLNTALDSLPDDG